ncbi:hypothetical protein L7F22_045220 [Adiantum nelumboides]|nr:hypothetical protein [Adiantum nelumboides]
MEFLCGCDRVVDCSLVLLHHADALSSLLLFMEIFAGCAIRWCLSIQVAIRTSSRSNHQLLRPFHCVWQNVVDVVAWSDTYSSDTTVDLKKHHFPDTVIDKFALWIVKALRWPTDLFFQKRYGCRAMMLETVAAVPGMVGGMLLHLRSLRRFEQSGGWIKALLEEAENERMHLMTFMEIAKPRGYERALVFLVQGIFFNAYFVLYIFSPRLAHRITGYLEEEAIFSYTEYLKEIDKGHLPNVPAPAIAIDYWRLPKTATIRDVVVVVRADEAHHRDVNHFAADVHEEGKKLNDSPAPVGYH